MEFNDGQVKAIVYDWHNQHCLRVQRDDIDYWRWKLAPAPACVLVLGAGTGRVAIALAETGRHVVAVDFDGYRLERLESHSQGVKIIQADFCASLLPVEADDSVFPYSTFQLLATDEQRVKALRCAAASTVRSGRVFVDVSARFSRRSDRDWHVVLEEWCSELDELVVEHQREVVMTDHLEIQVSITVGLSRQLNYVERWYFCPESTIVNCARQTSLELDHVDRGYGALETEHRTIYCFRHAR